MFVLEFKVKAKTKQYQAPDDAIRTAWLSNVQQKK